MASKLAAAKIAAWSGVSVVIAAADRPGVLSEAADGTPGIGTVVRAREARLGARKLWIAFAVSASGTVIVDEGARAALVGRGRSLLPAGVVGVSGTFDAEDAVEIATADGIVFAKGLVRQSSATIAVWAGRQTADLPTDVSPEIVHRDDMVVLP
jgi:glutamate 5-kinase